VFLVLKRKALSGAIVYLFILAVLLSAVGFSSSATVFFNGTTRKLPIYGVDTSASAEKVIAFTFDAAWGADKTQGILDIMKQYDAVGTFFLVGFWIDKYPEEVKAIANAGFDIGNHSKNHLNMPKLSVDEIHSEIEYVNAKVQELTGKRPVYFRAPFGDYNNKLMTCLEEEKMVGVQWSIDSLDWKGLSAKQIVERILPNAKSGDIVLFHNNSDHVLDALPLILAALKGQGYKFVPLSNLVATKNYTVDSNGIQHINAVQSA
jgi:polysaccharide deacetylase family sporulation protein PdaB